MARSLLSADVHIDLWCRHCKCAIEWASSFERIDELVAFVVTDPGQGKIKPDRVEQRNVCEGRLLRITTGDSPPTPLGPNQVAAGWGRRSGALGGGPH
jgi:hypothetical protein